MAKANQKEEQSDETIPCLDFETKVSIPDFFSLLATLPPSATLPPYCVADGGFKLTFHFQLPNSLSHLITNFQNYDQIIPLFILNRES